MRSMQSDVEVFAVYQPNSSTDLFFGVPVINKLPELDNSDCLVLSSMEQTADLLSDLDTLVPQDRLLIPEMLLNMNYRNLDSDANPNENRGAD